MTSLVSAISASLNFTPAVPPADPGWVDLSGNTNLLAGCVRRDYNVGYFADNLSWLDSKTPSSITFPNFIDIGNDLNYPVDINDYTIQWTGYFIPQISRTYRFRTYSDDASYFWIGTNALIPTIENANVNNGGYHGGNYVEGFDVSLTLGRWYPIRALYGEAGGSASMRVEFTTNRGSNWTTINNMVYDGTTDDGFALP